MCDKTSVNLRSNCVISLECYTINSSVAVTPRRLPQYTFTNVVCFVLFLVNIKVLI